MNGFDRGLQKCDGELHQTDLVGRQEHLVGWVASGQMRFSDAGFYLGFEHPDNLS